MAGRGAAQRPNGAQGQGKICQFKLVLLGESAVGKSSLVLRFVKGQFHEYQESTIGGNLIEKYLVTFSRGLILKTANRKIIDLLLFCVFILQLHFSRKRSVLRTRL